MSWRPSNRAKLSRTQVIGAQVCDSLKYYHIIICRNCLVGASYHIKISDCAMFRPIYKNDYYRDQDNDHDVLPLRWIPWEVYIMVRNFFTLFLLRSLILSLPLSFDVRSVSSSFFTSIFIFSHIYKCEGQYSNRRIGVFCQNIVISCKK